MTKVKNKDSWGKHENDHELPPPLHFSSCQFLLPFQSEENFENFIRVREQTI